MALEILLLVAFQIPATKLALAVDHLRLHPPAEPDLALLVESHVGQSVLPVQLPVVRERHALLPRAPLVVLFVADETVVFAVDVVVGQEVGIPALRFLLHGMFAT